MKQTLIFIICLATILTSSALRADLKTGSATVQIALLLDTSNSMDGLIEQAKNQLWKIVNEMARVKKDGRDITFQVALYEYGNDNLSVQQGYIRQIAPLTVDLDKISQELFNLRTNGGSEYCGKVIDSAAENLQWSKESNDLKIIFIAGNEPFTQGDVAYGSACKKAIGQGIIVNTIFCGNYQTGIDTKWKDGADLADGNYLNIDQDQHIVHIPAPQDTELTRLGQELNQTYIPYGKSGVDMKKRQAVQDKNAEGLSQPVLAERAVTKASSLYKNVSWDLVDAVEEGVLDAAELDQEALPVEMKDMSKTEQKKYVEQALLKRKEVQQKINQLNEDRRKYLAEQRKHQSELTLDAALIQAIKEQALSKHFSFE